MHETRVGSSSNFLMLRGDERDMKKDLEKCVENIIKETADIIKEAKAQLGVFHEEREKMASTCQAVASAMDKKRASTPVDVEASSDVKTAAGAVEAPSSGKSGKGSKK